MQMNHSNLFSMTFAVLLAMTLTVFTATAQNIKVKGTVADASGEPIIGATVIVEGTKTGLPQEQTEASPFLFRLMRH